MAHDTDIFAQLSSTIEGAEAFLKAHGPSTESTAKGLCLYLAETVAKTVREIDGEYCVIGESGKNFGCYKSKGKADERLDEIKTFSEKLAKVAKAISATPAITDLPDPFDGAVLLDGALKTLLEGNGIAVVKAADRGVIQELRYEIAKFLGKKDSLAKGLPAETAEAGIHIHGLSREDSMTKSDGPHDHIFILEKDIDFGEVVGVWPAGTMLWSEEGGSHAHALAKPGADTTAKDGEHFHAVMLPNGQLMETTEDGAHSHMLQVSTTCFDGVHQHILELPDGNAVRSCMPGMYWENVLAAPPQKWLPPIPNARLFAMLPEYVRDLMWAALDLGVETYKNAEPDGPYAELIKSNFKSGSLQAMKVPDPGFVMKRLANEEAAGILSKANRRSRVDQFQVLVNELTPLRFESSFMWGIVKHGAAQEFSCFDEMPAELVEGLDAHTKEEFAKSDGPVFYLPFTLVKSFDQPVKLHAPPKGRRFATSVDLEKDALPQQKCVKCRTSFEKRADEIPVCLDCEKASIEKGACKSHRVTLVKSSTDEEQRIVFGAVLVPDDTDSQGDIYTAEEVQKAAWGYMERNAGHMKLMHKGDVLDGELVVLETFVSKKEMTFKNDDGEETYPAGTWFMTTRVLHDEIWADIKKGDFTGYSIGGAAIREALT